MNKNIKLLVEEYFNSTDQMNNTINQYNKDLNKLSKKSEERYSFITSVLGKQTYNKYSNKGVFAPLPLSALHLTFNDFYYLNNNINKRLKTLDDMYEEKTIKLITSLSNMYPGKDLRLTNTGITRILMTNIVFKTIDDVIDFLINIKKAYKKIYKDDNINWKNITIKFRKYLN